MATQFTFSIQDDFPNQAVDASVLTAELEGSTISAALVGIGISGDAVVIDWDTDLTTEEETTQATIIGSHRGEPFADGVQRETVLAVQETTTSDFADLVAATLRSEPLEGGEYTASVSFELEVDARNDSSAAQAQVRVNGAEVMSAVAGINVWDSRSISQPVAVQSGDTPTIDVRLRRIGTANTARIRRVRIALAPVVNGEGEES